MLYAYRIGFYGPKYVWILPGWIDPDFVYDSPQHTDCTVEQLSQVAQGKKGQSWQKHIHYLWMFIKLHILYDISFTNENVYSLLWTIWSQT